MKKVYKKYAHFRAKNVSDHSLFSLDIEDKKVAELTGISHPTVNKFYKAIREHIAEREVGKHFDVVKTQIKEDANRQRALSIGLGIFVMLVGGCCLSLINNVIQTMQHNYDTMANYFEHRSTKRCCRKF